MHNEISAIAITSWTHLDEELYKDSWQESLGRFRSNYIFRGRAGSDSGLQSSLMQLGGDFASMETHLLRNFRKYAHSNSVSSDSIWHWLAMAQHHGLPTRLLDWTYSPYVALHFATADLHTFEQDSVVHCINCIEANNYLPKTLSDVLKKEGSFVFTAEMLSGIAQNLEALDRLHAEPFVLFLEPPSLDERIVNQFALFSLMSDARASLADWLAHRPQLYRKLIIPAALKREVRDKLDQANITERVLFPGLDGLSAWLTRYYTTKRPRKP